MSSTERLQVALVAAAVGAAVGASTTHRSVPPPSRRDGRADVRPPAAEDRTPGHEHAVPARTPSRVSLVANAVSLMAVGALVTLVVLWGTGTFDPSMRADQAAAAGSTTGAPLPLTAADLASEAAASEAAATEEPTEQRTEDSRGAAPPRADPAVIEIPVLDVQARVVPLGLEPTGELEVPEDFDQTGWWTGGAVPGEVGPSVIVGHVDSYLGPAVFFELGELAYDDLIRITRADGSAATFAVRSMVAVEKDEFPTDLVYGPTPEPQLRLITCDGDFADGSYLGNLIVTADLVMEHAPPTTGLLS